MGEKISISDVPRHLRAKGVDTTYNFVWRAAVEGRIPAEKQGARWFVRADDMPRITEHFAPVSN
jgi:hypothetical protein